jgi:hypothetical protein
MNEELSELLLVAAIFLEKRSASILSTFLTDFISEECLDLPALMVRRISVIAR